VGRVGQDDVVTTWHPGWDDFPDALWAFWTERHLTTLTTLRPDGTPHVVPVGVALDAAERCAWAITSRHSRKARNLAQGGGTVAACQVDGARWSTMEGQAVALTDPASVRRAEQQYALRYRVPRENPDRVALRIEVDRFLFSRGLGPPVSSTG
jgi:PPOX class probable F420-dependent enzyme